MVLDLEEIERHRAVWEDLRRLYDLRNIRSSFNSCSGLMKEKIHFIPPQVLKVLN